MGCRLWPTDRPKPMLLNLEAKTVLARILSAWLAILMFAHLPLSAQNASSSESPKKVTVFIGGDTSVIPKVIKLNRRYIP